MNTPLLLTSFAILAGVAARPIDNERRDELRELLRHPDTDTESRQAFLGRIPPSSGLDSDSLNSLQLHDLHDSITNDSKSPKLTATDLSDPDPGLASPYIGPQRQLSSLDQEITSPTFNQDEMSSSPHKSELPLLPAEQPDYSPKVVILVFSSLAALVLLGLTVTVVYATQLLRSTVFKENVWRSIVGDADAGKGGVGWFARAKLGRRTPEKKMVESDSEKGEILVIAAQEISGEDESEKAFISAEAEDPDVYPLPENPPASPPSVPAINDRNRERNMGLALLTWTYDNRMTHLMIALFGWLGIFFRGARN